SYVPLAGSGARFGGNVRALFAAANGDLWIAGRAFGVHRLRDGKLLTLRLPLATDHVRAFAEDASGGLWAGTLHGQLFRLESSALLDATPANFPRHASVRTLYHQPDGSLWIGFTAHGLGRLRDGKFTRISTAEGLWDDAISQVLPDGKGSLWLGGNRGLFRLALDDYDAVQAGKSPAVRMHPLGAGAGVPPLQASSGYFPNAGVMSDGRLAFTTSIGVLLVDPGALEHNPVIPPVQLTSVDVDGTPRPLRGEIVVPSRHQRLTFHFTAYSFSAPENVHFRHRLLGLEDSWTEASPQRNATYVRVPPGRYAFQVIACNNDGVWNESGSKLAVVITPAFWETRWFLMSMWVAVAVGGTVVARYVFLRRMRRRLQRIEKEAAIDQERARIAREMHDELGANLTQIALLGDLVRRPVTDALEKERHAVGISTVARQTMKSLDEIVWAVNPRHDLLPNLLEYLGQYAIDYLASAQIRCRIDFPDIIPPKILPADVRHHLFLAAKEALHNVVKHASAPEVSLRVSLSPSELHLSIEDHGCGFERREMPGTADGLRNIESRMQQAGGHASVQTEPGHGTRVTLVLPWPHS
ncbi:MAG: sensor histidine kinase, partial [Opitutaceae bacterium]